MRTQLPWKGVFHTGKRVSHHSHGSSVLAQFAWHDLVESVSCGVVIVKVGTAVLQHAERWNAGLRHSGNVCAWRIIARLQGGCPNAIENGHCWREELGSSGTDARFKTERMPSACVAFYCCYVAQKLRLMILRVGLAARTSALLIHPGDDAESAPGPQVKLL